MTSSLFSADARFVLTGSDDGNVRIWKANASEKLGVITARERAAIEYRDSLKERWKMDAQVGKVARSVFILFCPHVWCLMCPFRFLGHDTSRSLYIRRRSSKGRCWMHNASRMSGEENTHALERRSRRLRGRRWCLSSKHNCGPHNAWTPRWSSQLHRHLYALLTRA